MIRNINREKYIYMMSLVLKAQKSQLLSAYTNLISHLGKKKSSALICKYSSVQSVALTTSSKDKHTVIS